MTRDPCRDALDHAIADATQRIELHACSPVPDLWWRRRGPAPGGCQLGIFGIRDVPIATI
jgi:hypothetical protein